MSAPIRALTLTTLYPNRSQPYHGLFVEQRLLRLVATGRLAGAVVAPVPWVPPGGALLRRYRAMARVPPSEERGGLAITHPRFPVVPKIGMPWAPRLMALGIGGHVRRVFAAKRCELLDAHYFYPDGVAAALLRRDLRCPLVITARGSDINLIAQFAAPRRQILWAANEAAAVVAVSEALRDRIVELGVPRDKVVVLRNGVDLERFRPLPEAESPRRAGSRLLTVANLVPGKGHDVAIGALAHVADASLTLAGDGPLRGHLERLVARLGLERRVRFLGAVAPAALVEHYNEADATVLVSAREGMPNVVLESLACGTPVIASAVGGIPEVLKSPVAGVLLEQRTPESLASAIRELSATPPPRAAVRAFAADLGWERTVAGQLELYERVRGA